MLAPLALLIVLAAASQTPADCCPGPENETGTLAVGLPGARVVECAKRAEALGFRGAVLAALDGEVVAAVGVGSADLAGEVPNTPATLFELASASKQFTAAAVLALAQDKKLKLDDPISKHLRGVPRDCAKITVRHLLQHTSGIPRTNSSGGGDDLEPVLPLFLEGGPRHEPGTHFEYWNQGYALLSAIVEKAAREPFVDYSRERLFERAKLKVTRFTGDPAPEDAAVAGGRSAKGAPRSALADPYGSFRYQYRGMGGVVTNVWDLWRWDRALKGDEFLKDAAKRELFDPGLEDYALGWYVHRRPDGRVVQEHGGAVRGFVCQVRRYPKDDGCLFVLCNRDDFDSSGLADLLERALFDAAFVMPPKRLASERAAALVGTWRTDAGRSLEIALDAEGVARATLRWGPEEGAPVTRGTLGQDGDETVFFTAGESLPLRLERDRKSNRIVALELSDQTFRR